MSLEILQRPHATLSNEGVTQLVLVKDGKEYVIMELVTQFSRAQAKTMREALEGNHFRYAARYCNNGLTQDLMVFISQIESEKVTLANSSRIDFDGSVYSFWGDVVGRNQSFCFIILDDVLAYRVMKVTKLEASQVLKAFMARRQFSTIPKIKANVLDSSAKIEAGEKVTIPPIFELQPDGSYLSLAARARLILEKGCIRVLQQILPTGNPV